MPGGQIACCVKNLELLFLLVLTVLLLILVLILVFVLVFVVLIVHDAIRLSKFCP